MPNLVVPAPQFRNLSETEVLAALDDPNPVNPIACEVARLVEGYTANFREHVERLGHIPAQVLRATPQTAIEAIAMRLTTEAIRDTIAAHARGV